MRLVRHASAEIGCHPAEWKTFSGGASYDNLPVGIAATLHPSELLCTECITARTEFVAKAKASRRMVKYIEKRIGEGDKT